jgi:hypothetical protein
MKKNDITFRPIVIDKPTIDRILQEEQPMKLLGLYTFYYYTAIWQETNQPKVTNEYVCKGLKISKPTLIGMKKTLKRLKLIRGVTQRDAGNVIIGHYIRVCFYHQEGQKDKEFDSRGKVIHSMGNDTVNAYSNNSKMPREPNGIRSADTNDKTDGDKYHKFYVKYANKLHTAINATRCLKRHRRTKLWVKGFRLLHQRDGVKLKRIKRVLYWYCDNFADTPYVPHAYSATAFREKFLPIEDAMKRQQEEIRNGQVEDAILNDEQIKILDNLMDVEWPMGSSCLNLTDLKSISTNT